MYKVMRKEDSKIFILKLGSENATDIDKERVKGESALLAAINSDYLVNCVEVYEFQNRLFVFLDYMEGGSLNKFIENYYEDYSEETMKYMVYMSAMGIKCLHDRNVLHRDIKSDNILCRPSTGEIKVADLGLAVFLTENQNWRKTRSGTMNWFSPEIVNGVIYSKEVDVWAFGAMLHEIGKGQPPFMEFIRNEDRLFDAIATAKVYPIDPTNRTNISEGFNNLMMSCFKVNPNDRPTID